MPDPIFDTARRAQQKALRKRRVRAIKRSLGQQRLSPTQEAGRLAEQQAARHLQAHGVQILAHNLANRMGEIDLLGWHGNTLVFFEVRQRHCTRFGGALSSVTLKKQRILVRTAQSLLAHIQPALHLNAPPPCRFDVVAIQGTDITWIQHAFVSE